MSAGALHPWSTRPIAVRWRLGHIGTASLLFVLVAPPKHSLKEAARCAGRPPALFSTWLPAQSPIAIPPRDQLSSIPARKRAKALERVRGWPWNILLIIAATIQHRASLPPAHANTCNPGKGDGLGHPWPHIVLVLGALLSPLTPMPCDSKGDCRPQGLTDHSAPQRVVDSLQARALEASLGAYARREGVGLTERGYADKKIEQARSHKGWHCISALGTTRRVQAPARALRSPTSKPGLHGDTFFRRPRRRQWDTVRLQTSGNNRTRMALRIRHPTGSWRHGGQGELGCADRRNRPDGRRTYLAGHELRATPRPLVTGYRLRWSVERWPKSVKQNLGFEDGATQTLDAVVAPVPWVDGADLLLPRSPPRLSPESPSVGDRQSARQPGLADHEKRHILQPLPQIGGVQRDKDERRQALADA